MENCYGQGAAGQDRYGEAEGEGLLQSKNTRLQEELFTTTWVWEGVRG